MSGTVRLGIGPAGHLVRGFKNSFCEFISSRCRGIEVGLKNWLRSVRASKQAPCCRRPMSQLADHALHAEMFAGPG